MSKNVMQKNLSQTILRSLGRYIAIVAIIALGCAIFVGLRITKTDMVATGQKYTDEQNMFHLRLVNTYGWSEEDVEKIADIADKFTTAKILSSNELRQIVGRKPSTDPSADQLTNPHLNQPKEEESADPKPETETPKSTSKFISDAILSKRFKKSTEGAEIQNGS